MLPFYRKWLALLYKQQVQVRNNTRKPDVKPVSPACVSRSRQSGKKPLILAPVNDSLEAENSKNENGVGGSLVLEVAMFILWHCISFMLYSTVAIDLCLLVDLGLGSPCHWL